MLSAEYCTPPSCENLYPEQLSDIMTKVNRGLMVMGGHAADAAHDDNGDSDSDGYND